LKCKAVAGCANNQLLREEHGDLLHERGILVAPDFVINAGGLINVSFEMEKKGYHPKAPRHKTDKIYDVLMSIYEIAEKSNISTTKAAIELAKYKIRYGIGKRADRLYFHHSAD
jgi:leucine dehydrogenase